MTENQPSKSQKASKPRSLIAFSIFTIICLLFFGLFASLGTWQVQRLGWKNDLIARAETRSHLEKVPAPTKAQWQTMTSENSDYTPVTLNGTFLNDKEVLITTLQDQGSGYWLMVPFQTDDGSLVFINRGFIPMDNKERGARKGGEIDGPTTVSGLLHMSEGVGYWPRKNRPADNRWYYRNIGQMSQELNLQGDIAPYFIDADNTKNFGGLPIGGLTHVTFTNNHLVYAITWYLLALGTLGGLFFIISSERKQRREKHSNG